MTILFLILVLIAAIILVLLYLYKTQKVVDYPETLPVLATSLWVLSKPTMYLKKEPGFFQLLLLFFVFFLPFL